jgi:hypothetical protein
VIGIREFEAGGYCRKARRALTPCIVILCVARFSLGGESAPSPREEVGEVQRGEARSLFREGVSELDAGRYAEALEYFQRAYVLWDSPKILLNIATTLRALGQNAEAATAYARYLGAVEPDSPRREEVAQALQEVRVQLGRIVSSNLLGVTRLWLDDVEITAVAGQEVWVEPGAHTLVAERTGGARQTVRITVAASGVQSVDWTPSPSPSPPPAPRKSDARRASPSAYSKLRALARADFDLTRGGAVGAGGIAFDAREWLRVTGGALVGAQKGAWVGLESAPIGDRVRPVLGTSMPVFFVGPAYPGVSGELGVRFVATAQISLFTRAALAHFPTVPSGYVKTLFVPSAGLEVGL